MNKSIYIILLCVKYFLIYSKAYKKKNNNDVINIQRTKKNDLFFIKSSVKDLGASKFIHTRKSVNKRYIQDNEYIKEIDNDIEKKKKKTTSKRNNKSSKQNNDDYETFLIVDGSSILFKNFFGMPFLKNDNDVNLSTIYGFIQSLNKIYNLFLPTYIAIVFDSKTSNNDKKKIYANYKIFRRKNPDELYEQLKIVSNFCDTIGIKTISSTNIESDNYIAQIVDNINNTLKEKKQNDSSLANDHKEKEPPAMYTYMKNDIYDNLESNGTNNTFNKETNNINDNTNDNNMNDNEHHNINDDMHYNIDDNEFHNMNDDIPYDLNDDDHYNINDDVYNNFYDNIYAEENVSYHENILTNNIDKNKKFRVIVVSSDKDLLQLLEYNNETYNMDISICQPNKKYRLVNANLFYEEHEILPSQYSDYLILAGDKTDGISGVPYIGDKTSKCLLKEYHNIENILKNLHKLPSKLHHIFLNNIDNINTFRKLIKLKCETNQSLVFDDYKQKRIKNFEQFRNFADKYSLHKLLKKSVIVNYHD
ncbi:putative 5'-3' exonuclease, N-terminal resolvase-like domain [Plasmodium gaboni]|uniref:Putative 5'-3' exonuclease, N-terminal resolvase-like domain n=1 Tax=Plasmodium gaboni TaxID=647221 RepID=A0A151LWF3_9APIC|nr:putative 5'-3' exonuclease, N-terminal resolvase-like domain [Plasmodium gaboni]KYO03472.1 putative 5'-3' exonuclease, N-terminal resolvase-like domain [Plasmodium gaboni]